MLFAVLLCLTYSVHFSIQSPILSPSSTPQHENENKISSTNSDDWSTAASTHVVGILPMLTTQSISLVITTPETETVNFTVSNLTQTIANGSVTAGLLVTTGTNKKISVTVAMSHFGDYSAGMYVNYPALFYPVNSYVYYAVSIGTDESTSFSSLLIVSGNNNTNITITPTVTVTIPSSLTSSGNQISLNAGQSITIQLQYLETLLLKPVTARADLTGTKVESSNPISVYSGHTCGFIPVGQFARDFVGEQIPPVASWGNEFLVQSFYNRQTGYNKTNWITDSILIAQFSLAQFADFSFTSYGDPAMTIIPPLHQYASNVTSFPIISLLGASTSVNLVVLAADDSSQIQLNGTVLPSLTSSSWKHYNSSVGGCYVFNSYSLSGTGEVSVWSNNSNDKILAMVYGLQQFIGYSYTGNLDLKPSEACFLLCEANYVLNTDTCTCSITNICELSPCQNGGSCTLVSTPSNYFCDCTGTGYQGITCTNVNYIVPNISAFVSYVAVLYGSSVTLRCVLHHPGNPEATIQWTFAGSVITNNSLFHITEGSTRLDITNITTSYSGAYHCNASNVAGASVATIKIDVHK
uniref:Ig-like domain-containing protein n=1 Tax=Amphimedon queenslandica TaxID=400682 RepID=A0A1X7T062_AMPQE